MVTWQTLGILLVALVFTLVVFGWLAAIVFRQGLRACRSRKVTTVP